MHKSTLETHSLDGASRIVTMAERLADEEMDTLKMEKPNAIPGESPAWNVAYAAGNEARRIANLQKAAADTCGGTNWKEPFPLWYRSKASCTQLANVQPTSTPEMSRT